MIKPYNKSILFLTSWILIGLIVDIIVHIQNKIESIGSIPHLITDSGIIAVTVSVILIFLRNDQIDHPTLKYIGTLGVIIFLLGGIGDTILHLIGVSDESLFSRPTHLLILLGGALSLYAVCQPK
jgi:hypothetical protein